MYLLDNILYLFLLNVQFLRWIMEVKLLLFRLLNELVTFKKIKY